MVTSIHENDRKFPVHVGRKFLKRVVGKDRTHIIPPDTSPFYASPDRAELRKWIREKKKLTR